MDNPVEENAEAPNYNNKLDTYFKWTIIFLSVLTFFSVAIYFWILGKHFSLEPADWGAFGSYLGGILGPAVAFAALIGLVLTIALQRNALDFQVHQFRSLTQLQREANKSQQEQLKIAADNASLQQINSFRESILQVIAGELARHKIYFDEVNDKQGLATKIAAMNIQAGGLHADTLDSLSGLSRHAERAFHAMSILSNAQSDFLVKRHVTYEEVLADVNSTILPAIEEARKAANGLLPSRLNQSQNDKGFAISPP
ncbi:MAG: hypothetical protein V4488_26245 [Pseudomonadota bacterium]